MDGNHSLRGLVAGVGNTREVGKGSLGSEPVEVGIAARFLASITEQSEAGAYEYREVEGLMGSFAQYDDFERKDMKKIRDKSSGLKVFS